MSGRRRARFLALACIAVASFGAMPAHASTPTPPFNQCPVVGADTSCELLIVFNADGSVGTYDNPALGPYDGIEDTLIGVENDTSAPISSVNLTSTTDAFGFDGDGLCSYAVPGCPFGTTGYEGPGTSFTNISSNATSGTLNFTGGLAAGSHTYFSLEEHVGLSSLCVRPSLSVSITSPITGHVYVNNVDDGLSSTGSTVVSGSPITLTATTSDISNTSKVDFFIDGSNVGTATSAPYTVTVTPPAALGTHVISAAATQIDQPACVPSTTLAYQNILCPLGPTITAAVTKPVVGDLTYNDADKGPSGTGSTLVGGSPLTLAATTSNLSNTLNAEFLIDGTSVGTATAPPFEVTVTPPSPGPHVLTVKASQVDDPTCIAVASSAFEVVNPSGKAVARDVIQNNIPVEVHVLPGGASVEGGPGSQSVDVVNQPLSAVSGFAGAFNDSSTIASSNGPVSESDAIVQNVSLLGGLIKAKTLHAHAKAAFSFDTVSASSSDAGTAIEDLTVNGAPVPVDQPNTTVTLPNDLGKIVLHEVIKGGTATDPEITVNALHAFIHTPSERVEVILGSAFAGANMVTDQFFGPGDLLHQEDDLGTHADAGDTPGSATPISDGLYGGGFTNTDQADWYSFDAGQGDRILLSVIPSQQVVASAGAIPVAPSDPSGITPFVFGALNAIGTSTESASAEVHLFDPSMTERYRTLADPNTASVIDFNADTPFTGKGRWLVEVNRTCQCTNDVLYSIGLNRSPVEILPDDDATTSEPNDTCETAHALPAALNSNNTRLLTGGFQNGDTTEAVSFTANKDQLQSIVVKADELAGTAIHARLYGPAGCGSAPIWEGTLLGIDVGGQNGAGSLQLDFNRVIDTTGTYTLTLTRNWNGTLYGDGNYYVSLTQRDPQQGH
ncbi:MAG: choice-of-anchor P family protein [Actinomycetota bacterium]